MQQNLFHNQNSKPDKPKNSRPDSQPEQNKTLKTHLNKPLETETVKTNLFEERSALKPTYANAKKIVVEEIKNQKQSWKSINEMLKSYGGYYSFNETGHHGIDYLGYQKEPTNPDYYKMVVEIENKKFNFNLKDFWK